MLSIQHLLCRPQRQHLHSHPQAPRCPEGWLSRGCRGVWRAKTMRVSILWQLREEVPKGPQRHWSHTAPSSWFCASSRSCGEVSSCTWNPFLRVNEHGPCLIATEDDGDDKICEMIVASPDPVLMKEVTRSNVLFYSHNTVKTLHDVSKTEDYCCNKNIQKANKTKKKKRRSQTHSCSIWIQNKTKGWQVA